MNQTCLQYVLLEFSKKDAPEEDYVSAAQTGEEGENVGAAGWPSQSVLREILAQRLCAQLNTQPYGPETQKVVDALLNTHRNFVMHGSFGAT